MPARKPIADLFEENARAGDGSFAIAFALLEIADQQRNLAYQVRQLGFGDAATSMGALESLGKIMSETGDAVASALREIAERD